MAAAVTLMTGLSAVSCDDGDDGQAATIEMFSWWVAPGEAEALDALLMVHQEQHPSVTVINAAEIDAETARDRLQTRFAQGFPPDTFQANGGFDLTRWVSSDGLDTTQSVLEPLTRFYEREQLGEVLPPAVIDAVSVDGEPYAVPVNIHRNNSLFYNVALLQTHGVDVPQTLPELFAACEALEAADAVCITIGAKDTWPLALLLWENVMVASAGAAYHKQFFEGGRSPDDPELQAVIDDLFVLWSHVDPMAFELGWTDAVDKVGAGTAAFTVMGDWTKGLLIQQGLQPGIDFGQVAFPGTGGTFVFATDTFPLAKGGPEPQATRDLLSVMISIDGQVAFNRLKGSIPARLDAPADRLDVLGQQTLAEFRDADARLLAGTAPAEFDLDPIIAEALRTDDPVALLNGIKDFYDVLMN